MIAGVLGAPQDSVTIFLTVHGPGFLCGGVGGGTSEKPFLTAIFGFACAKEDREGQENGLLYMGTGMQPFCAVLQQRRLSKKT